MLLRSIQCQGRPVVACRLTGDLMSSSSVASSSSREVEVADRLAASCPPEPCTASYIEQVEMGFGDTPLPGGMDLSSLPFKRERPERPGEVCLLFIQENS